MAIGLAGCGTTGESDKTRDEAVEAEEVMEAEETEPVAEPEPVIRTVTITATGDCTLGRAQIHSYGNSFDYYYDTYGETYCFDGVRDVFENDDFTLINLECVLTTSENRVEKTYNLKGRPEYTGILTACSVEAVGHGNNHAADYGEESLVETHEALDAAGIPYAYNDHTCTYTTDQGITIGVVSVSLLSQSEDRQLMVKNGIESLRAEGADIVIAACHWGIEREYYPTDFQQTMAHNCIDWGADLVIGNHPHVLQGVEEYNGKVICYSLGNFCFGGNTNPSDKDTMMFTQTFTFVDDVLQPYVEAAIIPCRLSGHDGYNDYQPVIAEGDRKQHIIESVNAYSAPYSDIYFDENGVLCNKEQ